MPSWRGLRPGHEKADSLPKFLNLRSSNGFIMFVVAFAVFTDTILYGIIVPVTPTALHERAGLSEDQEQTWTSILLALYGAALLATSPIAGYVADRFESRYWPLLVGLITLGVSTALLCIGTSLALWILGRLFQGASAAVVWTVGLALMVDTVGKEGLGVAMGYVGLSMTFGIMSGPLLGGIIYGRGGYYAVFGFAFGLIGMDIVLRVIMIEKKHAIRWIQEKDRQTSAQDPTTETNSNPKNVAPPEFSQGQPDSQQDRMASESVFPHSSDNVPQRKKVSPFYTLLSSERMIVALWAYFVLSVAMSSFDSVLPLFVEGLFGWGKIGQGLIFIPLCVPHILDPLIGRITDKSPQFRRYIAAGALLAIVPPMVVMRFVTNNSISHKVLLCAMLSLIGACIASIFPPILVEASCIVQEKDEQMPDIFGKGGAMALSYGLLNGAFATGTIAGPFFAGFIRETAGWKTMTWTLALLTGVSGIPVVLFLGGFLFKKREQEGISVNIE